MSDPTLGQVTYLEIGSRDMAATRAFFGAVFGWPCHDEGWFEASPLKAGLHGDDPTPQIYVYFNVPDLDAVAARVRAAGGKIDATADEPGFGRFLNCRAPGGIRFGLHQT